MCYMDKRSRIARRLSDLANRDQIIRDAHQAGFTKTEIHQLSGVARTTINRILKERRMYADITEITAIHTDEDTAAWSDCAEAWQFTVNAEGFSAEITGKAAEGRPVVTHDGATYVLTRYYEPGTGDWFISAKPAG